MSFIFGGTRFQDDPAAGLKSIGSEHLRDRLILPTHLSPTIFGGSGVITAIDPDDPAAAGSTLLVADAGHQHPAVCGIPAALTRTATSAESSGTGFARDVHVHATDQMAWGEIDGNTITADQTGIGAGPTDLTGFATTFTPPANRRYRIHINATCLVNTSTSGWQIHCLKDGSSIGRFCIAAGAAGERDKIVGFVRDINPSNASHTYKATATRFSGTGTLDIQAGSGINGYWSLEDCGPS